MLELITAQNIYTPICVSSRLCIKGTRVNTRAAAQYYLPVTQHSWIPMCSAIAAPKYGKCTLDGGSSAALQPITAQTHLCVTPHLCTEVPAAHTKVAGHRGLKTAQQSRMRLSHAKAAFDAVPAHNKAGNMEVRSVRQLAGNPACACCRAQQHSMPHLHVQRQQLSIG